MLMISQVTAMDATLTLKLEGKLLAPWVGELESVCRGPGTGPGRVRLDLVGLSYADADGARSLEGLIRDGATVVACSGFVAELLGLRPA
jgi:hypothetical protein